jgi:hypothetical protein
MYRQPRAIPCPLELDLFNSYVCQRHEPTTDKHILTGSWNVLPFCSVKLSELSAYANDSKGRDALVDLAQFYR